MDMYSAFVLASFLKSETNDIDFAIKQADAILEHMHSSRPLSVSDTILTRLLKSEEHYKFHADFWRENLKYNYREYIDLEELINWENRSPDSAHKSEELEWRFSFNAIKRVEKIGFTAEHFDFLDKYFSKEKGYFEKIQKIYKSYQEIMKAQKPIVINNKTEEKHFNTSSGDSDWIMPAVIGAAIGAAS